MLTITFLTLAGSWCTSWCTYQPNKSWWSEYLSYHFEKGYARIEILNPNKSVNGLSSRVLRGCYKVLALDWTQRRIQNGHVKKVKFNVQNTEFLWSTKDLSLFVLGILKHEGWLACDLHVWMSGLNIGFSWGMVSWDIDMFPLGNQNISFCCNRVFEP